jgi:FtsP/CotA-like multicopper oxidase with cupredoxin domain
MNSTIINNVRSAAFLLAALLLTTASSYALDLAAVEAEWTPSGSATPISMWGFVQDPGSCSGAPVPWTTGPDQVVATGGTLTISLRNCLTEPVSLVIPGQLTILTPQVFVDDSPEGRTRVRAFTHEATAGGGSATYTWNNLKPGTYLYQSGSHPAKQIQMGLYGALKVGSYVDAVNEVTLLYSEVDPTLHSPVSPATPLNYKPKYFLINGQSFAPGEAVPGIAAGRANETLLIRFLNAGLMSHTPVVQGPYMKIIAEDGNLYPYPREQYSALLAAGKTLDALWTPEKEGSFAVYDRSMSLSSNGAPGGGMLVHLDAGTRFSWILFIPAITGMGTPVGP